MSAENPDPESNVQEPSNTESTTNATNVVNKALAPNLMVASLRSEWNRETLLDKCTLAMRLLCLLLSFLSFVIMASNKHDGEDQKYYNYQEYQYLLIIAILAWLYCMVRVGYQVCVLVSGKFILPKRAMGLLGFAGDQVTAYALLSAASAAIPNTNRMRESLDFTAEEYRDLVFTDMVSASISMAFIAFAAMASSALISGFKLSTQTHI